MKTIKLCDFGVSRVMTCGKKVWEKCGTPAYIAPEVIADMGYEGFYSDIWSLGILLFAMISGTVPFKAHNMKDLHKLIL
jgi:serine/threonine protein kinase